MIHALTNDINLIKSKNPLVHNITNFVTMDFIANGLLALGASPIMAHGRQEIKEMVGLCSAVVVNIGTLDEYLVSSLSDVFEEASRLKKPIILDPVGAGATVYRTNTCLSLLKRGVISVIKGNASEIIALSGRLGKTKGVDSQDASEEAVDAAKEIAKEYNVCTVISGKKDVVVTSNEIRVFDFGHPLMAKVTGMGCLLTAILAAFHAVNKAPLESAMHAVTLMGVVGEITAELPAVNGPASFKAAFIDQLYNVDVQQIARKIK